MSAVQHRDLADGRWWQLSLAEQLGHVGSEISRALRWASRNPDVAQEAFHRALELLDLTLADPRLRAFPPRLREIARAREVVADFFAGPNDYGSTGPSLQKYFDASPPKLQGHATTQLQLSATVAVSCHSGAAGRRV